MRRIRWRSVRLRMVLAAVAVLALLLVGAAIGFDQLLRNRLIDNLDTSLQAQTADRAALLDGGATPDVLATGAGEEDFVAVLTPSGAVLASTGVAEPSALAVLVPHTLVGLDLALTEDEGEGDGGEGETHRLRVATEATGDGRRVVVGRATESIDDDLRDARNLLLAGIPIVVALAAVLVWILVGRALRPVDRLRGDVDSIVATGLGQRVGAPGTADEIDRLASTMNDMLGRLDDQAEARRRFVSDASHELKSPVANVRALVESAGDDLEPEQWADLRTSLVGETNRLQLLVDDLLFLARGDEGRLEPVRTVVHLDDIVFDEAERLAPLTAVVIDASAVTPADVVGDAALLSRLVRNLVENAARHAASRVTLSLGAEDGRIRFIVADDGPGVPEGEQTRVFERFARVESGRARAEGGTGLGLAIVAQIAEDHGGRVDIGTPEGGGAAFVVDLPAAAPDRP
jgi:signal transduction histidine kinase